MAYIPFFPLPPGTHIHTCIHTYLQIQAAVHLVGLHGLITTANLSNTNAATALSALRLLRREPTRITDLQAKIAYVRQQLKQVAGLDLKGDGAVIHLPVGKENDGDAYVAWRILFELGIYCQVMIYPAVALGR